MADPAFRSSDPVLKVVSPPATTRRAASLYGVWLQYRRLILLVALPLAVALVGLALYLMGGRYITTDNAYVGAQKVLITPDIDGKISRVVVVEGQQVAAGDVLFEIDPVPFGLALTQAESRLATVRTELANLKTNLRSLGQLIELARQTVALKQNDVDRKSTLFASRTGSAAEADLALAALAQAKRDLELLLQQEAQLRNQLLGEPDLPLEMYPPSIQAAA
ncbi:MAG TPA: biotin/lipoyl-binding protein, partial [Xanthobacteraceae bacterium]